MNNLTRGTTKTLRQAILNALEACGPDCTAQQAATVIQDHVKDFMAQKFTTLSMQATSPAESEMIVGLSRLIIASAFMEEK